MRGPLNISVTPLKDDNVAITLGRRDAHLGMSTIIDAEQALVLRDLLNIVLESDDIEKHYQDYLAREAGLVVQIDQGGEVYTDEEDLA